MNTAIVIWVVFFFSSYVMFDAFAALSRVSASAAGANAFGAAIEKIMNTLKRLSIFTFPPALGFFVVSGDRSHLFFSIFVAYFFAGFVLLGILALRQNILNYFFDVAMIFGRGSSLFRAFWTPLLVSSSTQSYFSDRIAIGSPLGAVSKHFSLFILASWVYFIFGASIFFINLVAIRFSEFAPVILQGLGFVNGLGTLVLAFFVDPKISRFLDTGSDLGDVGIIVILSQLSAAWFISPLFFLLAFFWI